MASKPKKKPTAHQVKRIHFALAKVASIKNPTKQQQARAQRLQREYLEHRDTLRMSEVSAKIAGVPIDDQHRLLISDAAASVIAIADNYGVCLLDVISEMERYIVQETKVSDSRGAERVPDRRQYTLAPRIVPWSPPILVDCGVTPAMRRRATKKARRAGNATKT